MAEAHAKHHDYHLVDPSPWPLIGSVSAFLLAVGAVASMKSLEFAGMRLGPYLLGAGILGVIYTMISWWSDVVREATYEGHHTRVVQLHHRYGMIMFIASEVMFFVAWFWAYFDASLYPNDPMQYARVEKLGGAWPPTGIDTFDPWHLPLLNTLLPRSASRLRVRGLVLALRGRGLALPLRRHLCVGLWRLRRPLTSSPPAPI
jgi:cytochrome c oxidase subunit 3